MVRCRHVRVHADKQPGPVPDEDYRDLQVRILTVAHGQQCVHVARSALDDERQSSFHDGLQRGPFWVGVTPLNQYLTRLTPVMFVKEL